MVRRKGYPLRGELVICRVNKMSQVAAWCSLLEYPQLEGLINISEAVGKWIYDIREVVKKDKQYVAKVIKVEEDKNLVHLSLKRVSKREEKEKINLYRKEERAEKILEKAAESINKNLNQAYEEVGFLLQEKFGDLYSAFEEIHSKPEILENLSINKEWKESLTKILKNVFQEKELIIKVNLELKCYEGNGINKIKESLSELEKISQGSIKYISAPRYRLELKTKNPKDSEKKLKEVLENFMNSLKNLGIEGKYEFVK